MKTIKFYHESFEYNDNFLALGEKGLVIKAQRIVCPECNGEGKHFRRDLDENDMIASFREDGNDDGYDAYLNGAFDQICNQCKGEKVLDEPIWDEAPTWVEKCIQDWNEDKRLEEQVRRAECGYQW